MPRPTILLFLVCHCMMVSNHSMCAAQENTLNLVNPLIGTTHAKTKTIWGAEGGTYPGAVAPFGFMQLTPETRGTDPYGYDYSDSTICFFSCTGHRSGYPNGSSGSIRIMPVSGDNRSSTGSYSRAFSHADEISAPGYYSVLFRDNGTFAEATASVHAGLFRFTFPADIQPQLYLGDMGTINILSANKIEGSKLHTIVLLNKGFIDKKEINGGLLLTFPAGIGGENSLLIKIGSSASGIENTDKNLNNEVNTWDFDSFKESNEKEWLNQLSVVEIEDTSGTNKSIFYTALYHSFLLPWVVSDAEGFYRGSDGQIHKAKGRNQYGGFSTWDTFRTLHPLLSLLFPDRQNDMIQSMLDEFSQSGKLPAGPMTGHHAIPVIVDSYLKGISNYDSTIAYNAMFTCLSKEKDADFAAYQKLGYVPSYYSESVTKTVEYAYDDWALAQFAGLVMKDSTTSGLLLKRSFAYRNLFSHRMLFMLPRNGTDYIAEPGNLGYKEGDKWSYSLFVPHNPVDLINLSGGCAEFVSHLDSALSNQNILFDNETIFHVPYLFNYAGRPDKTQEWVKEILSNRFADTPGGLPGNDDLGSLSSWFVFSSLGVFPACPGRPSYDLGSPLFKKATIHLQNRNKFIIRTTGNSPGNIYVKARNLNGSPSRQTWITHKDITKGGILEVQMGSKPAYVPEKEIVAHQLSETKRYSNFKISGFQVATDQIRSDQAFFARFRVTNSGPPGTRIVRVLLDGKAFNSKYVFVSENETVTDSVECRLYGIGKKHLRLGDFCEEIEVIPNPTGEIRNAAVLSLSVSPVGSSLEKSEFGVQVMNKSGVPVKDTLCLRLDGGLFRKEIITLTPGEIRNITFCAGVTMPAIHTFSAGSVAERFKIYSENRDSKILDISPGAGYFGDSVRDRSGFDNHGIVRKTVGHLWRSGSLTPDSAEYYEFRPSKSLNELKNQITVMAWVYPLKNNQLSDIISKGDHIVMQAGAKTLTFFAGGWGRGVCESALPTDWTNKWHHIAGVYNGNSLKLYIDGNLSSWENKILPGNLLSCAKWMVKRNEEFPDIRYFKGQVDHIKIFAEPLTDLEIKSEMRVNQPLK